MCVALIEGQKENKKGENDLKVAEKIEKKGIVDICPLCGSKMEKGYIASKIISWSKIKTWSFKGLFGGEIIVSKGYPYHITNVEAYRCRKCKLVIFRYGKTYEGC